MTNVKDGKGLRSSCSIGVLLQNGELHMLTNTAQESAKGMQAEEARHRWSIDQGFTDKLGAKELKDLEGSRVFGWSSDP